MTNWKKEGYSLGDKVLIVSKSFYGNPTFSDGEITQVGTKILKVKSALNYIKGMLVFNESRCTTSKSGMGCTYYIYKSREEYEEELLEKEEENKLKIELKSKIDTLKLNELKQLDSFLQRL